MSLIDSLSLVKDSRRKQGERYSCISMLLMIIMGIMRGCYGYREIGRFCKLNERELLKVFRFKNHHVPSHVSFRSFIMRLDFDSLQQAFYTWARTYVPIEEGEWFSIDGKSIRSTVSDPVNEYQNFVSLVSLFNARREQVLCVKQLENKKSNEGKAVEELLDMLDLKGVVFTMDALHCKKNAGRDRKARKSLSGKGER